MNILFGILSLFISAVILYQFLLAIAALSSAGKKLHLPSELDQKKLLVLIPAYKEDDVIIQACLANQKINYLGKNFDLMVISDQMKAISVQKLRNMGVRVKEIELEKSTKVKALNSVIGFVSDSDYEGLIILDADNIMSDNYLLGASSLLSSGKSIIQTLRTAKNLYEASSVFDAISERANHKILCKGANVLGLSSKLSGSGMILDKETFLDIIPRLKAVGGFDKEMELLLTKKGIKIYYNEEIFVLDEKCFDFEQMGNQRGRWLEAQYSFLINNFQDAWKYMAKGNVDYFHKVMQLAIPPRTLIPAFSILLGVGALLISSPELAVLNFIALFLNILTYIILVPPGWIFKNIGVLIAALPSLLGSTFKGLSLIKESKRNFIHTKHLNYDR